MFVAWNLSIKISMFAGKHGHKADEGSRVDPVPTVTLPNAKCKRENKDTKQMQKEAYKGKIS